MPLALLALAISAFGIGTTEFVMMGLLPNVADDLGTSVPTAGYLVSAYALGVVIGAPLLTALGSRMPRKRMLVCLMAVFTVGNLASALAPTFGLLVAGGCSPGSRTVRSSAWARWSPPGWCARAARPARSPRCSSA